MATALGATRTNADWPIIAAIFDWWFLSSDRRRGGVNRVELPGTSVVHKLRRAKRFASSKSTLALSHWFVSDLILPGDCLSIQKKRGMPHTRVWIFCQ